MLGAACVPLSAKELCEAVRNSRPINTSRLDRVLQNDPSRGLIEIQASATWESLAAFLQPARRLAAMWAQSPIIGHSVNVNAPGPDGRPIVVHVEAITLVTADGELSRISRNANARLFGLVVGGQGLFGALYSVTLRLESIARAANDVTSSGAPAKLADGRPEEHSLQLLVPPGNLDGFLAQAGALCAEWRIAIESVQVRRTLAENETVLRWARDEYAAAGLRLEQPQTLGGAVRTTQLCRALIDAALARGGSFPIACTPQATRGQVEACYPQLAAFLAEKRRLDPAGRLTNPWYRHYRSLLERESCEVRWGR